MFISARFCVFLAGLSDKILPEFTAFSVFAGVYFSEVTGFWRFVAVILFFGSFTLLVMRRKLSVIPAETPLFSLVFYNFFFLKALETPIFWALKADSRSSEMIHSV